MVRSHVTVGEVESSEIRYAITSLKRVDTFAHAWRKHWKLRMASIIVWMCPSTKTIPASEKITRLKTWQWFAILRFLP